MSLQYLNIYTISTILFLIITLGILFYRWQQKNTPSKITILKYLLLTGAVIISLLCLLWPQGKLASKIDGAKGIDIVLALDVSKSMNTYDFQTNNQLFSRLQASKSLITNFLKKHPNDRFALIVFAMDTTSIIPLTFDHNIFLTFLGGVDWQNVTQQGTNLTEAISLASQRFDVESERAKVLILISDGGDNEEVDFSQIKEILKEANITLITVGIGSKTGGKIVEGKDVWGNVIYKNYQGEAIVSKLNETNLKKIASQNNGEYLAIHDFDDLNKINKKLDTLNKKALNNNTGDAKQSLIRYLSFLAGVFWLGYLGINFIKRK